MAHDRSRGRIALALERQPSASCTMARVHIGIEHRGSWWIDSRDRSWAGVFSFTPEKGGLLALDTAHGDFPSPPSARELPLIFGETIDGKPVTLLQSFQTRTWGHAPGGVEVSFDVRYALIGAWFETLEDVGFDRVDFLLTGLDEWAGISGFDVQWGRDKTTVSYTAPDPVELATIPGSTLLLNFSGGGLQVTRPQLAVEMSQATRVSIRSNEEVPLATLAEQIHEVRNFLCFALRRRTDLLEVKTVVDVEIRRGQEVAETRPEVIEILYRTDAATELSDPPERRRMLFRLEDCPTEAGSRPLEAWLAREELLGPVYDLYLLSLYAPRTHLEFVYLSLTEGLEALHSRKFPHYELPREAHAERVASILAAAPERWRDWLDEKLRTSNKASFRAGLKELVETLPSSLRSQIDDVERFTQRVSWTRNYLTHWTRDLKKKAAKGEDLIRLMYALRLLLEALLLLEIGFSPDTVDELYVGNSAIQQDIEYAFARADEDH